MSFFSNIYKIILILLPAIGIGCCAYAQSNYYTENERKFYGGLVMGTNFIQVDGDQFAGYNKIGLNVGGIMYLKLSEQLAASMEILYSQKGSKSVQTKTIGTGYAITAYGITLNYAEIPVLINLIDKHKSHFGAGFSYSRLATSSEYITTNPPQVFDLTKYPFNKSDINWILSGNLHLWKGLYLNGRFQYSLIPIRDKIPQSYAKATQYNNLWVMRLMYLF